MLREVVQTAEQAAWDKAQRIEQACRRLSLIDPDLVEWTFVPREPAQLALFAGLLLTDADRPLRQLARMLRRIAARVEELAASPTPSESR